MKVDCSVSADEGSWLPTFVLLTCEHAGREIPAPWRHLFKGERAVVRSHRGYDPGAFEVALRMATQLAVPVIFTRTTRLLIDTNRSLGHPQLFSDLSGHLPLHERQQLIDQFYTPHRSSVETLITAAVNMQHRVLHVAVHSFTDVLDGVSRDLDLALLFDPARSSELSTCQTWRAALRRKAGELRHRFNEPYQGVDDGLSTALRAKFSVHAYAGVEVEIRQGLIARARAQRQIADLLASTLAPLVQVAQQGATPQILK